MPLQLSLALTGSVAAAMSLEDPYDNSGLDGIFVGEVFSEVEQVPRHKARLPAWFWLSFPSQMFGRLGGVSKLLWKASKACYFSQQRSASKKEARYCLERQMSI